MLGSSPSAAATLYTATANPTPSSPTRPSRLRGLSYLLHRSEAPPLARSTSSPGVSSQSIPEGSRTPTPTQSQRQQTQTTTTARGNSRQVSHPPTTTAATTASAIQSAENGWIPTIGGRPLPTSTSTESALPEPSHTHGMMTRSRNASGLPTAAASNTSARRQSFSEGPPTPTAVADTPTMNNASASASTTATPAGLSRDQLPTIRFIPHVESRSSRPSLQFNALSRTLKAPNSVVRVGRFSERDNHAGDVVGFKSKVVSRRHCEFWCTDGQWYIKDVKSSSGTFLNHVRLSSPGVESRPYPLNDGDVVQLGIDFKGGEEVIFRCVKIRIECNRGWQKSLNNFNTSAHKRLFKSATKQKTRDSDAASVNSSECSICLNPVAPCQALFVAPCSHVWHYKCIRNLIHGPNYPNFLCPNCRFVADLEADVEPPEEEDEDFEEFFDPASQANRDGDDDAIQTLDPTSSRDQSESEGQSHFDSAPQSGSESREGELDEDLSRLLSETNLNEPSQGTNESATTRADRSSSSALPPASQPIAIGPSRAGARSSSDPHGARSTTPTSHTQFALSVGPIAEGPMTPRNDTLFALDGGAGQERIGNNLLSRAVADDGEPGSVNDDPSHPRSDGASS